MSDPSNNSAPAAHSGAPSTVPVWDAPLRIFHWTLVASVLIAWFSANLNDTVHEVAGYTVIALIVFRVVWGFTGTRYARFTNFVRSPRVVWRNLMSLVRARSERYLGHNPAGAAMIVTLLLLLAIVSASGWMMLTVMFFGVTWVELVHSYSANAVLILAAVHIVAVVLVSVLHKENLVRAMITGRKELRSGDPSPGPGLPDN